MIWGKHVIFVIWHIMLQSHVMASQKRALAFRPRFNFCYQHIPIYIYIEIDTHSMYIDVYICA